LRGSESTEKPTDSRKSKEERREARELQQTGTRYKERLEQVQRACSRSHTGHRNRQQESHRSSPPEQVQQIRLTPQLRTL